MQRTNSIFCFRRETSGTALDNDQPLKLNAGHFLRLKLILLLATTFALFNLPSSAASDTGELVLSATSGISSAYIYRGIRRASTSWQAGVNGTLDRWQGDVWMNCPFVSNQSREIQLALSYTFLRTDAVMMEVRSTGFFFAAETIGATQDSALEPEVQVVWDTRTAWRPAAKFAYEFRSGSQLLEASLGYEIALTKLGTYLELRFYCGKFAAGSNPRISSEGSDYNYWGADLRIPYRVTGHWMVIAEASLVGSNGPGQAWSHLRRQPGYDGFFRLTARFEK